MYLRSLHLRHFRNYSDQGIHFGSPKTILVGDNAQGKTNLLEAVELLATLRSRRASRERELVSNDSPQAQIAATIERLGVAHELVMDLRSSGRRSLKVNGQPLRRQSEFLGQVNAVLFSSLDLELVRGGPESRRNWLDGVLTQLEPIYTGLLEHYRKVLKQRNALLKAQRDPAGHFSTDVATEMAFWNDELATAGSRIMRRRARLLQRLDPLAEHWHQAISGGRETLKLTYRPQVPLPDPQTTAEVVQAQFMQEIQAKATAELALGSSLVGPHRDDVEMSINDSAARAYGSQGQQRTLVLALKLAELELIEQVIGEPPLLLLDDVLAELDLHRQNQLLDAIQSRVQTLVTTTHLGSFDARWLRAAQIVQVQGGQLSPYKAWDPSSMGEAGSP
ncbi:DNA replication/repair protein RecF [Synechococcus sp. Nb3U1]|uniref:DNA replication/repair protein RecF n=1 Tax=Synechococcus sp. Nb3U1 TaxID=1914529 RepID=UPI001F17ACC7|nr:DNA replication/repair protein RecF [Synechococcus sp. Nb3U1]MCF2970369.1 DNA replication/repair protein RecF [Synechococcus sp. Nb3U1]